MTLGPRKRWAIAAAALIVAAVTATTLLAGTSAALVLLGVVQVVTLVLVAYGFVELERRRRRADRLVTSELERVQDELSSTLHEVSDRVVASVVSTVDDAGRAAEADRRATLDRLEKRLVRQRRLDFEQIEALLGLYASLRPSTALPASRGWAASPDLLLLLVQIVRRDRPRVILDCGSGASTVVLAAACRRNGAGSVVALDHDDRYARRTRELLVEHRLEDRAEVRHAPLDPRPDGSRWYRESQLPAGPIDLVLVDGPPAGEEADARAPVVDVLVDRLAPAVTIVVDDLVRSSERSLVDLWQARVPGLEVEIHRHEKGTAVLRRPA